MYFGRIKCPLNQGQLDFWLPQQPMHPAECRLLVNPCTSGLVIIIKPRAL